MTPVQQARNVTGHVESMAHLLLTEGDVAKMAESPEQVMEEIRLRATQVGSVLEGIFHESHGHPHWEFSE